MTDIFKTIKLDNIIMFLFLLYMITYNVFSYRADYNIISHITLFVTLILICAYILIKSKIFIGLYFWLIVSLLLWSVLTILWTPVQDVTLSKVITIAQLCVTSYLFYNYFDTKEKVKHAIIIIMYSYIFLAIYTIHVYGFNNLLYGAITTRIGQDISQENILGMSLATGSVLCFFYALYYNKKLYYLLSGFMFTISSYTGSRKALIIFVLGILFLVCMKERSSSTITILKVAIIALLVYLLLQLPMFEMLLDRTSNIHHSYVSGNKMEASAEIRAEMISYGWNMFLKNPIIGYGFDSFRVYWSQSYGGWTYSHNNYIEMLVNGGIIALFIFYGIYAHCLINLSKLAYKYDKIASLLITIMVIQLFIDIFAVTYDTKIVFINFALAHSYIRCFK